MLAVSIETVRSVHDVAAVLAIIAIAGAVLLVAARLIPTVASVRFLDAIYRVQLPLAALVATTATVGSLWFSESGNRWQPCRFCWFQRIFMYSAAVILIVAAIRRDRTSKWYVVPLATIGIATSIWHHVFLEHRIVTESTACSSLISCANPNYVSFGKLELGASGIVREGFPMTLAAMALSGFAAILALLLLPQPLDLEDPEPLTTRLQEQENGESQAG